MKGKQKFISSIMVSYEEKKDSILFSVLVNLLMLLFFLVLFRPVYETNDDMAIALTVNGAKGSFDAHLVYSNYILGLILSMLYRIRNTVPWYTLLQYATLFFSYTAIFSVIVRKIQTFSGLCLSFLVLYFFAYDGYIHLQYTKTAGIATAAGILLLLRMAECGRTAWKRGLSGYLLACVGFLYRAPQFLAVFAMMSGIGVFLLLESAGQKRRLRECLLRCTGIFAVLVMLIAGMYGADHFAYRSQEWQDYLEYNELRTQLLDYGFPNYKENKTTYQELGINRLAYQMYRSWNYADTEKFTPEIMRQLISLKRPKKIDIHLICDFIRKMASGLPKRNCFLCFLLVFLIWLCTGGFNKRSAVVVFYELAVMAAFYFFLFCTGRYLLNRVDVGVWLAAVLVLLWTFPGKRECFRLHAGTVLLLAVFCLTQILWHGFWRIHTSDKSNAMQTMRSAAEAIHEDDEHLYLVKTGTLSFSSGYGMFDAVPYNISENVLSLGGWPAMNPWYCALMEKWGITNPFRDMIGNDKVYLVDQDIDRTLSYLRKYYDSSAEAVLITEFPRFNIYQITSAKGNG